MTVVAVGELVVIVLLVAGVLMFAREERERNAQILADQALLAERERSELLTRIQRPDLIPVRRAAAAPHQKPKDAASLAKIGVFAPSGDDAA